MRRRSFLGSLACTLPLVAGCTGQSKTDQENSPEKKAPIEVSLESLYNGTKTVHLVIFRPNAPDSPVYDETIDITAGEWKERNETVAAPEETDLVELKRQEYRYAATLAKSPRLLRGTIENETDYFYLKITRDGSLEDSNIISK